MKRPLSDVAARLVVIIHLAFLVFVVFGSLLFHRWPGLVWLHLPLATWGVLVVVMKWDCPLTALENQLWLEAQKAPYEEGFIERYLAAWLFPQGLPRPVQLGLGLFLLLVNVVGYGRWLMAAS